MTALKICIFTETYYPVVGGGETQAQLLAEDLVARGFSVIILTRRSDAALLKVEQFGAVTIYRLAPVGRGQLKKWGLIFSSVPALLRLRRQYDLIFVSGFRIVGITAVLLARLLRKKVVLKADSQGEISGDFFKDGLIKLHIRPSFFIYKTFLCIRNKILKQADAFVAISSPMADELITYGVNPALIHMIPNGVDIHQYHPVKGTQKQALRHKLGLPTVAKIVIFTGRLVSYKGLPLLLRVWRDIQDKHQQVYLILAGSGGLDIHNCEEELREYVKTNSLQDNVLFTGNVENVHEYLQASDIFVFPTENEAFGISLIEAMACGLPVISTLVGGVKDILQHQRNGLVVNPGEFWQLYDALNLFISDISLSMCLGQAARQTVQESFSVETIIQKYCDLYRHLAIQDQKSLN